MLYVGAGSSGSNGSGVFQSLDNGATWTLFPSTTYGAVAEGGDLPHVAVTDLDVSLGNVNANTGMPTLAGPDQAIVFSGTLTTDRRPSRASVGLAVPCSPGIPSPAPASRQGRRSCPSTRSARAITLSVATQRHRRSDPCRRRSHGHPGPRSPAGHDLWPGPVRHQPAAADRRQHRATCHPPRTGLASNPVYVGTPITISGTSEISAFGNTTWITVEDVTNPADPIVIAGFNPNDPIPVPSSIEHGNSTDSTGNFSFNFNPATLYAGHGVKTIEIFATDNAGSVGNKVIVQFNCDPATQLLFASNGEPPATASPGANFATPLPVVVDAEDEFGNIATTYNGPVTISLANSATGLAGTDTVDAVAGVATFTNLSIATDGTYNLAGLEPRPGHHLASLDTHRALSVPPRSSISSSSRPALFRPVPASASWSARRIVRKSDHDLHRQRLGGHRRQPRRLERRSASPRPCP